MKKVGFEYSRITDDSSSSSSLVGVVLFPNLKELVFDYLPKWEEWEDSLASIKVMPCLSTLKLRKCDELKTLPDFIGKTPLQNLSIKASRFLLHGCMNKGGMEWPNISHIPNIKIDWEFVKKDGVWIQQEEEEYMEEEVVVEEETEEGVHRSCHPNSSAASFSLVIN